MVFKRRIPVGPLVAFVQLILLAVIGGGVAIAGYSAAKQLLSDTIQQRFEHATTVSEQILFEELDRLSTAVELFSTDDQLSGLIADKNWQAAGDNLYSRFVELSGKSVDIMLLVDAKGKMRVNAGNLIDDAYLIAAEMQPNLTSHGWYVVGNQQKYILRTTPITEPKFGEVVGYLLNGISLHSNVKVAQSLRRLMGVNSLGIYVDGILQISAPPGTGEVFERENLHPSTMPPMGIVHFGKSKLAYLSEINYQNKPFLQIVSTINAQAFSGLTEAFETSVYYILGLIVVGSLIALYVLQRVVIDPARHLAAYAQNLLSDNYDGASLKSEIQSPIQEFQDAAHVVQYVFNELQNTNANLEEMVEERTRALQVAESKTRQIVDSAKDGIITVGEDGQILSVNYAAETLFGYQADEMIGVCVCLLFPEYERGNKCEFQNGMIQGIVPLSDGGGQEYKGQRMSHEIFTMEISVSDFINIEHEKVYVWIIRDVSERKEAEVKLRNALDNLTNAQNDLVESEKMASLGGLVAGIAHEINTPVGVGLTAATHLHERSESFRKLFDQGMMTKTDLYNFLNTANKSTEIIESNLLRASELVRSFKQVAVDQTSDEFREINILGYIHEILQSLHPKIKPTKHVVHVDGDDDLIVQTHPGSLSQVITNLLLNSLLHGFESIEEGTIIIRVHRMEDKVHITYMDNGKGMTQDVVSRIFEPFFTTKRGVGGSGLGMHIVYNQVTQTLGGTLEVTSAPNEGATFHIVFPIRLDAQNQEQKRVGNSDVYQI